MKKMEIITAIALASCLAYDGAQADDLKPKRSLKSNMTEVYHVLPDKAGNFPEIFSKGQVYGRLRSNLFYYEWDEETASQQDHWAYGLGGSLIYKTAHFHGVSATVGGYTTQNPIGSWNVSKTDVGFVKSGKDTFDRNKIKDCGSYDGHWGMTSLAQAYLMYSFKNFDIKLGRQLFESFLTKSNDSKMIPNSFQGASLESKDISKITLKLGYFTKQKLRNHTEFHDVIAYNSWDENDDSAIHKGLTRTQLETRGIDTELVVVGITNKSIEKLTLDGWYTSVPDLFSSFMAEANYTVKIADGLSVTPGLRLMRQFDDGAGKIGGAALNGSLTGQTGPANGYTDAASVDASLLGLRAVLKKDAVSLTAGYTAVSDDADLITPWRGLPTAGYTRLMSQYNWEADTESWMLTLKFDFGKAGLVPGMITKLSYGQMDYDDTKELLGGHDRTDRSMVYFDLIKDCAVFNNILQTKIKIGLLGADNTINGTDPSSNDFRFEMNYLF